MQKRRKEKKAPPEPKEGYPMRLNKYLAHEGVATRRGADELITRGRVFLNDQVAKLGDKVDEGDRVELRGKHSSKKLYYFAYHKPVGVITHSPQEGEEDIQQHITLPKGVKGVFPIGRLDKDSRGLIILTNDGRVTDRLLNPEYDHDKEYRVRVKDPLREIFAKSMSEGIDIEGYMTAPCTVKKTGDHTFSITLSEGKKHQIRRMVSAHHNVVLDLERIRILNIKLDTLRAGELRAIEGDELKEFLSLIHLPSSEEATKSL